MNFNNIVFRSDPQNIDLVKKWLDMLAEKYNIDDKLYPSILISLTEAVNNAILHGNKCDTNKKIKLFCIQKAHSLKFKVIDEGEGFDEKNIPDPTEIDRVGCENGRGVHIMKSLAHKVKYHNQGSNVVITFKMSTGFNDHIQ